MGEKCRSGRWSVEWGAEGRGADSTELQGCVKPVLLGHEKTISVKHGNKYRHTRENASPLILGC